MHKRVIRLSALAALMAAATARQNPLMWCTGDSEFTVPCIGSNMCVLNDDVCWAEKLNDNPQCPGGLGDQATKCAGAVCPDYMFTCSNKKCIDPRSVCNGDDD
jgi:hypothetical protein